MKINSIQRDISLKQGGSGLRSNNEKSREKHIVDLCEDNRGYNAEYCGSFTGKSEAATTFLDRILKSGWFGSFAKYAHDHNISTSALIALVLAGIMRPATIMALPGKKDKEDKIYASGHAMASGIIGFLVSTAVTSPFDESIKKVFNPKLNFAKGSFKEMNEKIKSLEAKKAAKELTEEAAQELRNLTKKKAALETLMHNAPDWIIGVPRAILTIALIPPILKYVFGIEKKKKQKTEEAAVQQNTQQTPIENKTEKAETKINKDFIEKPVFSAFKGGVK